MARALALLVLALLALALACFAATAFGVYEDLCGYGYAGFSSAAVADGRLVTAVDAASPAARAGLRPGDVIEEGDRYDQRLSFRAGALAPGVPVALVVQRAGRLYGATFMPELRRASPAIIALDVAKALCAGIFLIVAGRLALSRPGLMAERVAGLVGDPPHGRFGALAESLFFAHRARARERLRAAAADVAAMLDRPSIEERFLRDAFEVLELAACGAYRLTRNEYVRTRAFGNADGLPVRFSPNSALAVALRSWPQRPFDLEQLRREPGAPLAAAQPRIAFPVRAREQVAGIFLVTARANGTPLSAADIALLSSVANAAASAYERLAVDEAKSAPFGRKPVRFSLPFSRR
jgi:hypothetical protein